CNARRAANRSRNLTAVYVVPFSGQSFDQSVAPRGGPRIDARLLGARLPAPSLAGSGLLPWLRGGSPVPLLRRWLDRDRKIGHTDARREGLSLRLLGLGQPVCSQYLRNRRGVRFPTLDLMT